MDSTSIARNVAMLGVTILSQPLMILLTIIACMNTTATAYQALELMRKLSNDNIPFSFSYIGCNLTQQKSSGLKTIAAAKLRTGLSRDKGIKSESLIGYTDLTTNEDRWFYLPLLYQVNNITINEKQGN